VIDVLVAGGGPAGLAVAIRCAMAGLSATVAEPRQAPVDKACGEGLMPAAAGRLAEIGVRPSGIPFRGIRYLSAAHQAEARFRGASGLGVRRTALQSAMDSRAAVLGVEMRAGRITGFVQDSDGVTATLGSESVRARYLVGADGLHSAVRRGCGLNPPPPRRPRFGLRRHYAAEPWTDLVEVYWARDSEAYVTPVGHGMVGIAVLGARNGGTRDIRGRHDGFEDRLAAFPALRERLDGASPATGALGAGPLRQDVPGRALGRVLLAGDASGYTDALTGEGIGAALAQAEVLASCLAADRPGDYERAWRRATRASRLLTSGLLWSRHQPLLAPRIVPAAQRLPGVFTAIVNQVGNA